jgi:thymidylate synthase
MSEQQYLFILQHLLTYCNKRDTRNGVTYSSFSHRLVFDLQEGFPLLTTKKMFLRGIVEELAWFLRGSTDVQELRDRNVHIWDHNTSKYNYDAGPAYGFQWRHSGANYVDCKTDYTGQGEDQVQKIINLIKTDPHSRRIFMSAWNPSDQKNMSLPPCHVSYQFYVDNAKLSCQMYQRSSDAFLGLPFNIASCALLTHLVARETGYTVDKLYICLGDVHLYEEHDKVALEQINRTPFIFPTINIKTEIGKGLKNLKAEDVTLSNYICHNKLSAELK